MVQRIYVWIAIYNPVLRHTSEFERTLAKAVISVIFLNESVLSYLRISAWVLANLSVNK